MAATVLPACVAYHSAPIVREEELAALRTADLAHVVVHRAKPGENDATAEPRPFDPSDGLDEAETVAVALTMNPALRARRLAVGEARALLITAGAWPNPELSASWRAGIGGTSGYGVDADALIELLRSGERAARRSAAAAEVDAVTAEVVAQELETAGEVRAKRVDVARRRAGGGAAGGRRGPPAARFATRKSSCGGRRRRRRTRRRRRSRGCGRC